MQEETHNYSFNSRTKGKEAEDYAEQYLKKTGYQIIKKNFRFGKGEIDIIAKDGEILVFVEVKWRENLEKGTPESALTKSKIAQIKKIAEGYYYVNKILSQECRFDVIAIIGNLNNKPELKHLKTAFY